MTYGGRPPQIDHILKAVDDNNTHQMRVELETYIAELEAEKPRLSLSEPLVTDVNLTVNEPRVWSHQRVVEADARRRARTFRKRNNYQ